MSHAPSLKERLFETVASLRKRGINSKPRVGVVLGSGLGGFGDTLSGAVKVPYGEIPYLAPSTVVGHSGNLCFGELFGVPIVCMQGRIHLYEGHSVDTVVHGVRTMARLGVESILLTNAAGGLVPSWAPGDLMLVTDHLNLTGHNPLLGPNDDSLGARFVDMSVAYDVELRRILESVSVQASIPLRAGVYAGLLGPSYETPAEVQMLRTLGAHAVGMSTVLEVLALRHMGVRVAALSCITNLAAGISETLLDHREVEAVARERRDDLVALLSGSIAMMGARDGSGRGRGTGTGSGKGKGKGTL
jgi:purine-nucleoside phosphorylase